MFSGVISTMLLRVSIACIGSKLLFETSEERRRLTRGDRPNRAVAKPAHHEPFSSHPYRYGQDDLVFEM